jgi:hypothetical protein
MQPPPPLDYIRGLLAIHGDFYGMDIEVAHVEEIVQSFGNDSNFHILNRTDVGQSGLLPLSPPLRPASLVVGVDVPNEMDPSIPFSLRTLHEMEREKVQAQFELEAMYKAWSPNPEPPPTMKERTALAILIWHGLIIETVETGSLDDFKRVAKEFVASTSQRGKTVEAFTEFSMMEMSIGQGFP